MKFAYLLINLLTIAFPVLLSFDKRVQFYKSWKYILPGLFISGLVFLVWDYIFTICQVWSFNPDYVLGIYFLNLPIEEILFFITVPFACIFIYECLNFYIQRDLLKPLSKPISVLLLCLSAMMIYYFYSQIYTLVTFSLLFVIIIYAEFIRKMPLSRFYLAYLVSLVPFYLINGILTSIPVVMYNNAQNMGLRIGTIPFEDHFYSMALLLMNILFFEYFRKRNSTLFK